jgi:DNA-binding MurR/RpiR family transcriptional regulator
MTTNAENPLLQKIASLAGSLSPKQLRLARYVTTHPLKAAFLTSTALAREAEVSESTVIRFAASLGYAGYPQFQATLQALFRDQISSLDQYALDRDETEPLYRKVLALEASLLSATAEGLSEESFDRAVELLATARKVIVVGAHPNSSVAEYAAFFLGALRPDVQLVTDLNVQSYTTMQDLGYDSAVLAFSFPRYPAHANVMVEYLHAKGVPVIAVTDSELSPLAPLASVVLVARMQFITFIDPLASAMALVHSLLIGVFLRDPEHSRRQVKIFEEFWKENRLFLRKDIDIVGLL